MLKKNAGILISSFTALSVCLAGCGGSSSSPHSTQVAKTDGYAQAATAQSVLFLRFETLLAELDRREKKWNDMKITSYSYIYSYSQPFASVWRPSGPTQYVIQVTNDQINRIFNLETKQFIDVATARGQAYGMPLTIPEFFQKMRTSLNSQDLTTDVAYDSSGYFPTGLFTSPKLASDGEQTWRARDLQNCTNKPRINYASSQFIRVGEPTAHVFKLDMTKLQPSTETNRFEAIVYGLAAKYGLTIKSLDAQKGTFKTELMTDRPELNDLMWCEGVIEDEYTDYTVTANPTN